MDRRPPGAVSRAPLSLWISEHHRGEKARAVLLFVTCDLAHWGHGRCTWRAGTSPRRDHRRDPGSGPPSAGDGWRRRAVAARRRPRDRHGVVCRVPLRRQPRRAADAADHRVLRRARHGRRGRRGQPAAGAGRPLPRRRTRRADVGRRAPPRVRVAVRLTGARLRRPGRHDRARVAHHPRARRHRRRGAPRR